MKDKIEFSEFLEIEKKLEIRMGSIDGVERMEGSDKMLKMTVDFGEDYDSFLTVMTNIGNKPGLSEEGEEQELVGRTFPFITNLKPVKMMGVESHAMIMLSETPDGRIDGLDEDITPGAKIL